MSASSRSPADLESAGLADAGSARAHILARMADAAKQVHRDPHTIALVAVSKTQPPEAVEAVLQAGQRLFGENKVQEGIARWTPLRLRYPDAQVRLIGSLQSNKAADAVAHFDGVDSLDRPKLAQALAQAGAATKPGFSVCIQVNTGEEAQKGGVLPDDLPELVALARALGLPLAGLMCIPPAQDPPAPHFMLLAKLAAQHQIPMLSMGMSGDFETAIRCGAHMVRVGSALFGARPALG